jgi:cyanophycinase-like exopeptidase
MYSLNKFTIASLLLLLLQDISAQPYTSFLTGDAADVSPAVTQGIVLMGGATENDNAMRWFLNRSGGGDIVVIRATGSNGYNNYLYAQLGITVNSVETLVIPSVAAANDPYVVQQLQNAEAIWIAGGDQYQYVQYWRNTQVETILNNHINVKKAPVGGTSAGMAILGNSYFSAENGTVTSSTALNNPFDVKVAIGQNDFLNFPFLQNTITDTHYDNPDRKGRHSVFLARMVVNSGNRAYGIACEEFTAVCVDATGKAVVYGNFPANEDAAYFIQVNCSAPFAPENCTAGNPLNWVRNNQALKVYAVKGTQTAVNFFQLSDWKTGSGGEWQHWYVSNGVLQSSPGTTSGCDVITGIEAPSFPSLKIYPNPAADFLVIEGTEMFHKYHFCVYDADGKNVLNGHFQQSNRQRINIAALKPGIYHLLVQINMKTIVHEFTVIK